MNIYTLKVTLVESPLWPTGEAVWRTIEIKGNQTLDQLHRIIFRAFDRYDEHLYSFYMTTNRRDASHEYASPYLFEDEDFPLGGRPRNAKHAKLDKLGLRPHRKFHYLFDYGDGWEHTIEVLSFRDEEPVGRYPRITEKHCASPPQYDEWDEEESDEEEETQAGRVIPLWREPDRA